MAHGGHGNEFHVTLRCKAAISDEQIILRLVRVSRTYYRVGLARRQTSGFRGVFYIVTAAPLPVHSVYIATGLVPIDGSVQSLDLTAKGPDGVADPYIDLGALLFLVCLTLFGLSCFNLSADPGGNVPFSPVLTAALLHLSIELAPVYLRWVVPVIWVALYLVAWVADRVQLSLRTIFASIVSGVSGRLG